MDSMPPATTMSNSPARISWSASAIASRPDRQTLLTVSAGVLIGIPAFTAAWRAGIWPAPACRTWPMMTYCTCSGLTPARWRAALIATPPSWVAEKSLRLPSSFPIGVRAPFTITEIIAKTPPRGGRHWPSGAERLLSRSLGQTIAMTSHADMSPSSLGILRIDHVGIAVADLDEAIDFYARVFGMQCIHTEENQ